MSREQSAVLDSLVRNREIRAWPDLSQAQARDLAEKADSYLANYQRYHQPFGLTADIRFSNHDRARVEQLDGIGDAATWTGHYLAALAFKYSVTKDAKILTEIQKVLDTLDVLTRVTGQDGFVARFAGPAGEPAYRKYYSVYGQGADPIRQGFGTWAFPGAGRYTNLVWLGCTSRDVYLAVNLGLATTQRLVLDADVRAHVQTLVERILDRLIQDNWLIMDGRSPRTPWQPTPSLKASWLRTGATVNPRLFKRLYETYAEALKTASPVICKYCEYFPNNLEYATYYVLATLETDVGKKNGYQDKLRAMWQQTRDHLNAYFAAMYLSGTGDTSDVAARATLQGGLFDFPRPPRWDKATDNRARKEIESISADGKQWARFALPVRERVPADFLWQRSPFQLQGGGNLPLEYPGIDLFLPYWIGRQCGMIPSTD